MFEVRALWIVGNKEVATLWMGTTRNGPPDPLQMIAINLVLQAQNSESQVISVMRTSDMHCSCFTGLQNTCRNLLCRTILLILPALHTNIHTDDWNPLPATHLHSVLSGPSRTCVLQLPATILNPLFIPRPLSSHFLHLIKCSNVSETINKWVVFASPPAFPSPSWPSSQVVQLRAAATD